MGISNKDLNYMKEFLTIIASILIGFGLKELILLTNLRSWDKIMIFVGGGVLIFSSGYYFLERKYKEGIINILYVLFAIIIINLCRIIVP
jgi:hypothetical protein